METIVIHYSEIGTKGGNRAFFENKLIENLKKALGKRAGRVYRRYGRIICELAGKGRSAGKEETGEIREIEKILSLMPGVASFSFAAKAGLEMDDIKEKAREQLEREAFNVFKVAAKRSNKDFPKTSPEINTEVGKYLEERLGKKADYTKAEKTVFIEIGEKEAFVYSRKVHGIGGLPTGVSGKVMCSLSGGIDSPVAGFLLMKRGCKVVFVHIHNKTQTSGALGKIEELVKRLSEIQLGGRLYIVPFEKIQKEIILKVPSQERMIVYRRFMMRIINELAREEKAKGIVTGDSVGQVASQTLDNLRCIYEAVRLPIFSPLIGMNKEEIVNLGKKIGTYEISIQPYPDCCSFMIAQHPETKGQLDKIREREEGLEIKELVKEVIEKAEVKDF